MVLQLEDITPNKKRHKISMAWGVNLKIIVYGVEGIVPYVGAQTMS